MADDKTSTGDKSETDAGAQDKGSKGKSDDSSSSDGDIKKQLEAANAKIQELIDDRNTWKSKARQAEKDKDDEVKSKAEKEGNIDAIKASYDKELKDQKDLVEKLTGQLHQEIAMGALRREANGKVRSISQIEGLLGNKVTTFEHEGNLIPAVKNEKGDGILWDAGKPMSVGKYLDSFLSLEENENLALSKRKSGTGSNGAGDSSAADGHIPTMKELLAMPDKGAGWISANPDKLKKVSLKEIKIGG